jgi:hypothetical protein
MATPPEIGKNNWKRQIRTAKQAAAGIANEITKLVDELPPAALAQITLETLKLRDAISELEDIGNGDTTI